MKIVCLEGCSGTGKTTNFHLLDNYFRKSPINHFAAVEKEYEPFATEVKKWHKEKGPSFPFTIKDIISFANARAETIKRNFSSLEFDLLILDRYYYTSSVYQSNQGISPEDIMEINIKAGAPVPYKTFLLDCDPYVCFHRAQTRNRKTGGKHLFSTGPDKVAELRKKYLGLVSNHPEMEVIEVNKPLNEVLEELKSKIKKII